MSAALVEPVVAHVMLVIVEDAQTGTFNLKTWLFEVPPVTAEVSGWVKVGAGGEQEVQLNVKVWHVFAGLVQPVAKFLI